ncbi:hypothetical protein [Peloplasma aerotolerans]|jgi:hypothetical protein|uniref:Uncharacterized protein n=1 Tax=Peloplasma aerotolerans TaxID=3044389 RepID=A0AAW6U3L5_9MOLU|nr:hypothetical protein [Mariniplasma sp. M4Ah]MDI6452492.1 hypothetical protein [Mariniplasma sp. M4Ah]MDR4968832.1 hypothetical protein [Acholeplasmataceae bacterium]
MKIVNIKADKMRYQKNTSAYGLVLLSIATSLIALFTMINFDTFGSGEGTMRVIPNLRVGVEIALGIVLMLSTFMAAEKVKYYDPTWSFFGLFILAGINFLRIFNLPIYAHERGWIPTKTMQLVMLEFAVTAGLLVVAGIISLRKVIILHKHLKEIDAYGNDAV